MKIVAWNVGHRIREKPIPASLVGAVAEMSPDTLILNEFVDGASRTHLKASLREMGLKHIAVTHPVKGHNQILLASRLPHSAGDLSPPNVSAADAPNFLHRCFADLEVIGLRVPFYKSRSELASYWDQTTSILNRAVARRLVVIGDLNANPSQTGKPGGRALEKLIANGWQIPTPVGPWSFISASGNSHSTIDYAVVSPAIAIEEARYVYQSKDVVLAGPSSEAPLSDHAPLEVRLTVTPSAQPEDCGLVDHLLARPFPLEVPPRQQDDSSPPDV